MPFWAHPDRDTLCTWHFAQPGPDGPNAAQHFWFQHIWYRHVSSPYWCTICVDQCYWCWIYNWCLIPIQVKIVAHNATQSIFIEINLFQKKRVIYLTLLCFYSFHYIILQWLNVSLFMPFRAHPAECRCHQRAGDDHWWSRYMYIWTRGFIEFSIFNFHATTKSWLAHQKTRRVGMTQVSFRMSYVSICWAIADSIPKLALVTPCVYGILPNPDLMARDRANL